MICTCSEVYRFRSGQIPTLGTKLECASLCSPSTFKSWPIKFSWPAGVMNMHFLFPDLSHSLRKELQTVFKPPSYTMCYCHWFFAHTLLLHRGWCTSELWQTTKKGWVEFRKCGVVIIAEYLYVSPAVTSYVMKEKPFFMILSLYSFNSSVWQHDYHTRRWGWYTLKFREHSCSPMTVWVDCVCKNVSPGRNAPHSS